MLVLVEHSVRSHTTNACTPPLAIHSPHVSTKPLWLWGRWIYWFSSWRHYICICIILLALWMLRTLCVTYMKLGNKKQSWQKKKKWKWNMKSFSNEILDVFFSLGLINFGSCWSCIIRAILLQKFSWNSRMKVKQLRALQNHVVVNMLLRSSHLIEVH